MLNNTSYSLKSQFMESKKRLIYIDVLKGFTIFLVVLSHALPPFYSDETFVLRVITSFFMPLFMFISGYVSYKIESWNKIKQRFIQLIIPFFSAMLVSWFINDWGEWSVSSLIDYIVKVLKQPDLGLWFLWALFFINIIFLCCRKMAKKLHISEFFIVLLVAGLLNLIELLTHYKTFGYHWIAWYFIFFSMGIIWRLFLSERSKLDKALLVVTCILFPPLVYFFRMHNEPPIFYQWINLGNYFPVFYRLVTAFVGVIFWYEIFKHIVAESWKNNVLCKLGRETLPIYYLHFYCLWALFQISIEKHIIVWVIFVTILSLFVCYHTAKLCRKSKITRLLILGENIFAAK